MGGSREGPIDFTPRRWLNVAYNCDKGYRLDTNLPSTPGSYAIVMFNPYQRKLTIGALGCQSFSPGCYIYVGSAQGPGGLQSRVGRHLDHTAMKPSHWHIDALTSKFEITEVWWVVSRRNVECLWAGWLNEVLCRHAPNFGASDCRCPGHLFFTADQGGSSDALNSLRGSFDGDVHQLEVKSKTHRRSGSHGSAD